MISKSSDASPDSLLIANIVPDNNSPIILSYSRYVQSYVLNILRGNKYYWISTWGSGVIGYLIDSTSGMITSKPSIVLRNDSKNKNTISSDFVAFLWEDPHNNLWISQLGRMDRVNLNVSYGSAGSVEHFDEESAVIFSPEDEKSFWMIGNKGLSLVHLPTAPNKSYHLQRVIKTSMHAPPGICKGSDGTLFAGMNGGLFAITREGGQFKTKQIATKERLNLSSIQEDRQGRLWLYDNSRILCYDRTDSTFTSFDEGNGIDHYRAIEPGWMKQTSRGYFCCFQSGWNNIV